MLLRTNVVLSLSLPLVAFGFVGCADPGDVTPTEREASTDGAGGGCTCDCTCTCGNGPTGGYSTNNPTFSGGSTGNDPETGSTGGASGGTRNAGGTSNTSGGNTGGNAGRNTGGAGTGSGGTSTRNTGGSDSGDTGGRTECTDEARPSESCADAIQWGFCGQEWFSGFCEASCGICTIGDTENGTGGRGDAGTGGTSSTGGSTSTGGRNTNSLPNNRVDNPYVGATGYVNPEWKAKAEAEPGGSRVSNNPTGVWMDRIAAIDGTGSSASMGLRAHLDEALAQGAGYIQIVIYNLPGRDCAALSSNGELGPTEIDQYRTEYIDPIAAIESDPAYASLRIINIIEIDSLPNLVTNTGSSETATDTCDVMKANGNYQKGIQYALGELYKAGNTYNYIDAGHHGWIGWEENFNDSAALFYETASGADGGVDTVTGFITNTANYSALEEPFITATEQTRQSAWIDYNRYVDELSFAKDFRTKLVSLGFNSNIGMLIDTSRNGWGGPDRPTTLSTASDVDTMIDESRIDRRIHLGNWCNQSGAGLGERPQVIDAGGIAAYVWIKPPGESDGASQFVENDQGKGVDGMCDPTYAGNARNKNNMSGALPGAPLSGAWFSAQFQELMANAYPPLE